MAYTNSLKFLGPNIWNCLQEELKSANSLNIFKNLITEWNGMEWSHMQLQLLPVYCKSIHIRQVNDYPISFVSFVFHCKFNNKHNRKTKAAFDVMTKGPFDVYPCLFIF